MPSYEVIKACYVPVGNGSRYKAPGQIVTLSAEEAKNLDGYLERIGGTPTVRKPDTGVVVRKPDKLNWSTPMT